MHPAPPLLMPTSSSLVLFICPSLSFLFLTLLLSATPFHHGLLHNRCQTLNSAVPLSSWQKKLDLVLKLSGSKTFQYICVCVVCCMCYYLIQGGMLHYECVFDCLTVCRLAKSWQVLIKLVARLWYVAKNSLSVGAYLGGSMIHVYQDLDRCLSKHIYLWLCL